MEIVLRILIEHLVDQFRLHVKRKLITHDLAEAWKKRASRKLPAGKKAPRKKPVTKTRPR